MSNCTEEDTRYRVLTGGLSKLPTELDIQTLSGVYESLKKLPYFESYVNHSSDVKALIEYRLLGRQTISYSTRCEQPIGEATSVLKALETASDVSDLTSKLMIVAGCATAFALLFMIMYTKGFFWGEDCYPAESFKRMMILFMSIHLGFSVALFVISLINANRLESMSKSLADWTAMQDCADSFSQIGEEELEVLYSKESMGTCTLVLSGLALAIYLFLVGAQSVIKNEHYAKI